MASVPPTPSTLRSWEEAFSHPLPVVRKLESQLRTNISENQNKLRSLVGASYRDLLGTAERIIDMDAQMQLVESNLAQTGRRCDYRIIQRGRESLGSLKWAGKKEEEGRLEAVAGVRVLKGALEAVGRCVRKGGDALGGAKLLVLARLMHKSLTAREDEPALVAELGRKLAGLRKKLLAYIERSLVRMTSDRAALLNTLCAYVMVTSSTPKDVLRHFLQVRYEQLETKAETPSEKSVLEMLDLYSKTLLNARDLFPRRFADALNQLSKTTLLQDPQVLDVQELNLDIYQRWIPEDIRTFLPWVRHDQLSSSDTGEGLKAWARQAQACLLTGIEGCLQAQADAGSVLTIRRNVLSKYLAVSSKVPNENLTQSIDNIRRAFLERIGQIAIQSADISQYALASLADTDKHSSATQGSGPWDLAAQPIELSAGALPFRAAVRNHRQGRDDIVQQEHDALDRWLTQLSTHWDFVAKMRGTRWDDDIDLDIDELDYDNDQSLQDALSKSDPAQLEEKLRNATVDALKAAYAKVQEASETSNDAAFHIRILRELDQRKRILGDRLGSFPLDVSGLTSTLHAAIAEKAVRQPVQVFKKALGKRIHTPTTLWDGTPLLPVQPSPATFRFLASLQRSMAAMGEDLWSPDAVLAAKTRAQQDVMLHLTELPPAHEAATEEPDGVKAEAQGPEANTSEAAINEPDGVSAETQEAEANPPESQGMRHSSSADREARFQRLFDTHYLSRALSTPREDRLQTAVGKLSQELDLEEAAQQRLAKSAQEYWRRTYLLFGLLAA